MYKQLTAALSHTREDFATVCKLLKIDPEGADPKLLGVVMCDECGYWETEERATIKQDGTVYCRACNLLEDAVF